MIRNTPEAIARKDRIRELWKQGHSAGQIGEMMGCTRNTIIGHVARMKLAPRITVMRSPPKPPVPKPKPVLVVPPPPAAPASMDLTIEAVSDKTCRQPHGTQSPYTFCGNTVKAHSPYCPFHDAINRPPGKPLLKKIA